MDHSELYRKIEELLDLAKAKKPNDRGDLDRRYAILITEIEKIKAYQATWIEWASATASEPRP